MMNPLTRTSPTNAFTLAELLIALAILGVIATFTIPKILDVGSNSKQNAIVKETAAMVSGAYQTYKLNNGASVNVDLYDLTPYMNYVAVDTVSSLNQVETVGGVIRCDVNPLFSCLKLHNGATLLHNNIPFNTSDSTAAVAFWVDPDGVLENGVTTGPSISTNFWMYYNGRLRTISSIEVGTCGNGICPVPPQPTYDPTYFSWGN